MPRLVTLVATSVTSRGSAVVGLALLSALVAGFNKEGIRIQVLVLKYGVRVRVRFDLILI